MPTHPRIQHVLRLAEAGVLPRVVVQRLWMGMYGHFSAKPTKLFGDASGAQQQKHLVCCRVCNQLAQEAQACLNHIGIVNYSPPRPYIADLGNRLMQEARSRLKLSGKNVTKKYRGRDGSARCCGGQTSGVLSWEPVCHLCIPTRDVHRVCVGLA